MWAANVPESAGRGGQVTILSHVRYQVALSPDMDSNRRKSVLFLLLRVSLFSIMDFQHTIRLSQFMIVLMQKPFMSSQFMIVDLQ